MFVLGPESGAFGWLPVANCEPTDAGEIALLRGSRVYSAAFRQTGGLRQCPAPGTGYRPPPTIPAGQSLEQVVILFRP